MRMRDFLKEVGGSASDLFNLPVAALDPNPDNIRLDTQELREHIQTIAGSILASGFLRSRPLTVRLVGDRAIVVDGNCRFAAERYGDRPELTDVVARACSRVADKWNASGDVTNAAEDWALDLIHEYLADMGIEPLDDTDVMLAESFVEARESV